MKLSDLFYLFLMGTENSDSESVGRFENLDTEMMEIMEIMVEKNPPCEILDFILLLFRGIPNF